MDDRRGSQRQEASLPGQIETTEGKQGIAITLNVSEGGCMLFSRRTLAVGAIVRLMIRLNGVDRHLLGCVLRLEPLAPGESQIWRSKVAISIGDLAVMQELVAALSTSP